MTTYLKCHRCKGKVEWGKLYFVYRSKHDNKQLNVCKDCWGKARSLKVPQWEK